jgi:hypothetical protein
LFPRYGGSRELAWLDQFVRSLSLHSRIDGHHLVHWGHGGGTDVDNLVNR